MEKIEGEIKYVAGECHKGTDVAIDLSATAKENNLQGFEKETLSANRNLREFTEQLIKELAGDEINHFNASDLMHLPPYEGGSKEFRETVNKIKEQLIVELRDPNTDFQQDRVWYLREPNERQRQKFRECYNKEKRW